MTNRLFFKEQRLNKEYTSIKALHILRQNKFR